MATRTQVVGRFNGDAVRVELDWDDVSRRCATIRVVNGTALPVRVGLARHGGAVASRDFPPGTTTLALPASGVTRIFLDAIGDGRLTGADWQIWVPAP